MALEDIAGYSLRRGLGSGSVGAVWLVRDLVSGRHAVLKRIPVASVPVAEEFRRDLALARGVDHPHLARLIDVRQNDREWLLFSQYVAAGTLTALLQRRGPLSLGELVTLVSPLAQALGALHRAGLSHGHLSAGDVMFAADGRPVLTDAGLKLLSSPPSGTTETEPGAQTSASPDPHEASIPEPRSAGTTQGHEPSASAEDLAALAALTLEAGGDVRTFPPELFAGDGEQVSQRILALATPEPINLGFGDEARAGTLDPRSEGSAEPARPSRSASRSGGGSPGAGKEGPSVAASRPGTVSSRPVGPRSARGGTRFAGRGAKTTARPGDAGGKEAGGKAVRSRDHRRRPVRPAFGVLAMVGLGAVLVFGLGLAALGVFGGPGSDSAVADDGQRGASASTTPPAMAQPPATAGPSAPVRTPVASRTPGSDSPPRANSSPATSSPHATASPSTRPSVAEPGGPPSPLVPEASTVEAGRWLRTLQALDVRRARAFSTLDPTGLDAIYVPGSSPWQSDRSLLASYRDRRVRVDGLKLHIEQVAVQRPGAGSVVLRVVDRLVSGTAVDSAGRRTPLPAGRPTARLITLTGGGAAWRISAIVTV
jgi:serine/threonine protein kinase